MMKKINKSILFLFLLLIIPFNTLYAKEKTLSQWEKELNREEQKLNETNSKKNQNKQEINEANRKINSIYAEIQKIEQEINDKNAESERLSKEIEDKKQETKSLMQYYQISSSGSAMFEYVMGAKSITDLIYRLSITEQISNYNKKTIEKMNQMIKQNDEIKTELDSKKQILANNKAELNNQMSILNKTKNELDEEGHTLAESINEMKKTIKDLKKMGCRSNETPTVCQNRIYSGSGGYLPSGTTFYRPTSKGRMSSGYGWRTLYGKPNFHGAVDIAMPSGTPVYSVAPGRVAKVIYSNKGGGNQIIVHHKVNGKYYTSYYCHMSSITVSVGTYVTKDSIIGNSGNTGNSTGPHLHLGLAHGRWYVDYYAYYGNSGFIGHSFDPRSVIVFPGHGGSYSNR